MPCRVPLGSQIAAVTGVAAVQAMLLLQLLLLLPPLCCCPSQLTAAPQATPHNAHMSCQLNIPFVFHTKKLL